MDRDASERLEAWLRRPDRRPILLRGARQVGKTWLVRELARRARLELVELNFERDPRHARLFASNDPRHVLDELSLLRGSDLQPERCLLFLDEIQAKSELLAKLRWFAEELPQLAVVAAGSLLEFTLSDHGLSMPVGRIGFRHVEPMGFSEYLRAHGQGRLAARVQKWRPGQELSATAHDQATEWWRRYAMVGGMPAVVAADVRGAPANDCREIQHELVATYRADFAKYAGRMDRHRIDSTLAAIARRVGQKFVYARVEEGIKQHQAKRALELLAAARLCHLVRHTSANGLPLAGEVKDSFRKALLLDVGILHALLGTPAGGGFPAWHALSAPVRGQIAEQLAGQELRLLHDWGGDGPELFYWQREGGRPGEVDYLVQLGGRILPVELKSGSAGAMKSLHQFMLEKRLHLAVRIDQNPPSAMEVSVKTTQGDPVSYRLLSVPGYLVGVLPEAIEALGV